MNPLCIYHGLCADGFTAAWVVWKFYGEGHVDFHPGTHGDPPPEVDGREVYLVDFSYPRPVIEAMVELVPCSRLPPRACRTNRSRASTAMAS